MPPDPYAVPAQAGPAASDHDGSVTNPADVATAAVRREPGQMVGMDVLDTVRPNAVPNQPGTLEAPPASKGIRIVYKGKEEFVPEDTAATMLQQFKGLNESHGPYLEMGRRFAEAGYSPQDGANLIAEAVQRMQAGGAAAPAQAAVAATAATEPVKAAVAAVENGGTATDAEAEKITRELFDSNGLSPTPEAFERMKNMMRYGGQIADMAAQIEGAVKDIGAIKGRHEQTLTQARAASVDATAARVADELGVNSADKFEAFTGFLKEQDGLFPGYAAAAAGNPKAMEAAIRLWHRLTSGAGTEAETRANAIAAGVQKDAARAGGDFVPAAGGNPPAAGNFNDDMMQAL